MVPVGALKRLDRGSRGLVVIEDVERRRGVGSRADIVEADRHLAAGDRRHSGIGRPEGPGGPPHTPLADRQRRVGHPARMDVAVVVEDRDPTEGVSPVGRRGDQDPVRIENAAGALAYAVSLLVQAT